MPATGPCTNVRIVDILTGEQIVSGGTGSYDAATLKLGARALPAKPVVGKFYNCGFTDSAGHFQPLTRFKCEQSIDGSPPGTFVAKLHNE